MIKLQIIGHLGKDCVQKEVSGKNVINFSVAHSEKFKNASGILQEKTIWVNCDYWTDRTAIAPYLLKGQLVFVEGSPDVDAYTKQDGAAGASLRLRVREVQLLGGKTNSNDDGGQPYAGSQSSPSSQSSSSSEPAMQEDQSDDLPF